MKKLILLAILLCAVSAQAQDVYPIADLGIDTVFTRDGAPHPEAVVTVELIVMASVKIHHDSTAMLAGRDVSDAFGKSLTAAQFANIIGGQAAVDTMNVRVKQLLPTLLANKGFTTND